MKKKRFTGFVDGHFVSGTLTETDEADFQRQREETAAAVTQAGKVLKTMGKIALGALVLGAIGAAANADKK